MTDSHQYSNGDPHGSDRDPVLDSLLTEFLGGASPPDLTARILERQAAAQRAVAKQARADSMLPPSFASTTTAAGRMAADTTASPLATPASPRSAGSSPAVGNGRVRRQRRQGRRTMAVYVTAIALSALLVGATVGLVAYHQVQQAGGNQAVVTQGVPPQVDSIQPSASPATTPSEGRPEVAMNPSRPPREGNQQPPEFNDPPPFSIAGGNQGSASNAIEKPYIEPLYSEQLVALVDQHMEQAWADAGIDPSAVAADSEWARRVYLRVLGRIPTVAELTHYMSDDSPNKQAKLLDLLLEGNKYNAEFAENWAEYWTNVLIGRRGGMQEDSLASRDGLTDYLRTALAANKPFDDIAYELLTAEGANRPEAADYNGAVNFLLASYDPEAKLATNRTTGVFLGKQLQCAQCHSHHVNQWPQQQYWEVNSFLRQMRAEKEPGNPELVRLVDRDFQGASGSYEEAEVFFEQVNGVGKVAYPVWLNGEAINPSGRVAEVRRRVELAKRVVASEDFAQATANRLWDHFLGRGFTKPVDDMGPHNPPSHPEVLANLANQFAAHEYDLKQLIRWIALSEPFNLSSRPSATNLADSVETSERPLFSRYYTRQMEAEELYDSLVMLADSRTGSSEANGTGDLLAKRDFVGQFARDMNTDEGNEIINFEGSMQQSLSMMNGDLMDRATNATSGNILRRVLNSGDMSWNAKIEHLFLASLARQPTRRELQVADRLLTSHQGKQPAALQDLWWALLNSNEFILDH